MNAQGSPADKRMTQGSASKTNPETTDTRASKLAQLLAALSLRATPGQQAQLLGYLDLLERWNRIYNLTAVREPDQMLTLHLADCLALLPALSRHAPRRLLDVGSGGGLPGLVLAIMLPEMEVTLNDAVQKKCAFMQQAAAELRLQNVEVMHARVEQLDSAPFDCISSRAFSDLATLVRLSEPLLAPDGCWAAMKGATPQLELERLPKNIEATVQTLDVPGLEAQRCIVWMRRINLSPQPQN